MRKRVGIARAIALRPRYILYDEPTTGLDPVTTAAMNDLMIRARRELGATSVVVTHDLSSAFTVADRIAFLDQGRVRQAGTARSLRASRDPLVRSSRGYADQERRRRSDRTSLRWGSRRWPSWVIGGRDRKLGLIRPER
jgi:ABC-type transporter Mla maintaining outer membrane lipid asymmetry ATPase subunit MlaF